MSEVQWRSSGLPVTEAKDIKQSALTLDADVVIVGSGAGGAVPKLGLSLAKPKAAVAVSEGTPGQTILQLQARLGLSSR